MAISTLNSHIDAAMQLQSRRGNAYLVFGKTSAWEDDENPPNEEEEVSAITEVIGYKKLSQFSLARPLKEFETEESVGYPIITYKGKGWVLIPTDRAFEEKARWIYAEATIDPEEFPLGMYRQVGVHLGLEPNSGVTKLNLEPKDVKSKGILQFYENREPQNRHHSVYVLEQFMIKV